MLRCGPPEILQTGTLSGILNKFAPLRGYRHGSGDSNTYPTSEFVDGNGFRTSQMGVTRLNCSSVHIFATFDSGNEGASF